MKYYDSLLGIITKTSHPPRFPTLLIKNSARNPDFRYITSAFLFPHFYYFYPMLNLINLHMKNLKIIPFFLLALLSYSGVKSQRIRLIEGRLDFLKRESSVAVDFTYDNMAVGKFSREDEYVSGKRDEYNRKEPGRGDNWAKSWVADRQYRFEPKFLELFDKYAELRVVREARYTLIFHTIFTEPGFNVGVWKKNAEINAEVWVVETGNRGNVLAKISIEHAPGRSFWGNDYDTGERLAEAYAAAGKALGKFIKNKS